METELVSETLVFNSTLTRLIARENFITFMRRESLKSYKIKSTLNSRNACYHAVHIFCLPDCERNVKTKCKTIILHDVLYGCETWSLILRDAHRMRMCENRVLRRISERVLHPSLIQKVSSSGNDLDSGGNRLKSESEHQRYGTMFQWFFLSSSSRMPSNRSLSIHSPVNPTHFRVLLPFSQVIR
jgi:hypothetical protein